MEITSDTILTLCDTTAYIIIGFGDSIINGGQQTDNDGLATTILSDTLSVIQGRKVQFSTFQKIVGGLITVLNI